MPRVNIGYLPALNLLWLVICHSEFTGPLLCHLTALGAGGAGDWV